MNIRRSFQKFRESSAGKVKPQKIPGVFFYDTIVWGVFFLAALYIYIYFWKKNYNLIYRKYFLFLFVVWEKKRVDHFCFQCLDLWVFDFVNRVLFLSMELSFLRFGFRVSIKNPFCFFDLVAVVRVIVADYVGLFGERKLLKILWVKKTWKKVCGVK